MNIRGHMQVISDNLKAGSKQYEELAYKVHEYITDCWGPARAKELRGKMIEQCKLMEEKLSLSLGMLQIFRAELERVDKFNERQSP